ncbi:hypothetical protein MAHJHV59_47490 [Mycobacterium avium subsp. hominissuis]
MDGQIVEIEADITSGLPGVHLVGLPDAAHRDGERASQRHQPIPCRCVISGVRRRPTPEITHLQGIG